MHSMLPHRTQADLPIDGARLHYYRTGHGEKSPMVLVHGFSDNGLCWEPVARNLESEFDLIMPDMRGHGLSQRVKPGEITDMSADLAGLIRSLGLRRPIVCGHSMGAMATYLLGVRFPELTGALILEDPPFFLSLPPGPSRPADSPVITWAKDLRNHTLDELLAGYRRDHPDWPEELIRPMCESKKQLDPTLVDNLGERKPPWDVEWQKTIGNINQPLLLVCGEPRLGALVTAEVAAKVRKLNPKATVAHIPDVGHLIRFDKFAAYIEALRSFLGKLPR